MNVPGESTLRRDFLRLQKENKERSEAQKRQHAQLAAQRRDPEEHKRQLLHDRQKRIEEQKEQRRRLEEQQPPFHTELRSSSLVLLVLVTHSIPSPIVPPMQQQRKERDKGPRRRLDDLRKDEDRRMAEREQVPRCQGPSGRRVRVRAVHGSQDGSVRLPWQQAKNRSPHVAEISSLEALVCLPHGYSMTTCSAEFIRHKLEEEQRQLEVLQQQLLQEQALLM
ncbi:hypothetical protein Z043_125701, partial [Scleropages formosus]